MLFQSKKCSEDLPLKENHLNEKELIVEQVVADVEKNFSQNNDDLVNNGNFLNLLLGCLLIIYDCRLIGVGL